MKIVITGEIDWIKSIVTIFNDLPVNRDDITIIQLREEALHQEEIDSLHIKNLSIYTTVGLGFVSNLERMINCKRDLILEMVNPKENDDIVVIADDEPESLAVFTFFKNKFCNYHWKIHLMHVDAMRDITSQVRTEKIENYIYDLHGVKSIFSYNAENVFKSMSWLDAYNHMLNEYTQYVKKAIEVLLEMQKCNIDDNFRYMFNTKTLEYICTDEKYTEPHFMGYMVGGIEYIGDGQEEESIDDQLKKYVRYLPRANGKTICKKLRKMRKLFAKSNGIKFKFEKCEHKGLCAGTCELCDFEAAELYRLAKEKQQEIVYPYFSIETEEQGKLLTESGDTRTTGTALRHFKKRRGGENV